MNSGVRGTIALVLVILFLGLSLASNVPSVVSTNCANGENAATDMENVAIPTAFSNGKVPLASRIFWKDDFESDKGWTGYGGLAQWTRGKPVEGANGTSNNAVGTNLAGSYANNIVSFQYLTSPTIDCSGKAYVGLYYQRYLQAELSYDWAVIDVYDGSTWTNIFNSSSMSSYDSAYTLQFIDITLYAANKPGFKIRFGLQTDIMVQYTGWNIDDVMIYDLTPKPLDVVVKLPQAGNLWFLGSSYDVNWSISGGKPKYMVNVSLSLDNGVTYTIFLTKTNQTQNIEGNGTLNPQWLVPTGPSLPPSDKCIIKIIVTDVNGVGTSKSNTSGIFTIAASAPYVTVKNPNGLEKWYTGGTYRVNWTLGGLAWLKFNVTITLSTDGGVTYPLLVYNNNSKSTGSDRYDWAIPTSLIPSTTCRIKVNATGGMNGAEDISDKNFTIDKSIFVRIDTPVTGDQWYERSTYNITWYLDNGTAPYSVDVKLATDGVTFSTTIVAGQSQSSSGKGNYLWTIPPTIMPSSTCKIKVLARDSKGLNSYAISGMFSIKATVFKPVKVLVLAPDGGEIVFFNSTYPINWYVTDGLGPYSVDIWLSTDNGASYGWLVTSASSQANNGSWSYDWPVNTGTFPPSSKCKVLIEVADSTGTSTANDTSNTTFSIFYPLEVTLDQPMGGEDWFIGSPYVYRISWFTHGGKEPFSYSLHLSTDAGVTYPISIATGTQLSPNGDNYDWTIPSTTPESIECRVMVNITMSGISVTDRSPNNFVIRKQIPQIGNFTGTVVCSKTNSAVGGATVVLNMSGFSAETNPGGLFTISDIPSGVYTFTINASGYALYTDSITIIAFRTIDKGTIRLDPLGLINGRVVDSETNNPLPNFKATINMRNSNYSVTQYTTDNGSFEFKATPLDTYDIKIEGDGYKNFTDIITLTPLGPTKKFGDIKMEEIRNNKINTMDTNTIIIIMLILIILLALITVMGIFYSKKKKETKKPPLQFVQPVFTLEQYYEQGKVDEISGAQVQYPEGYYPDGQVGYDAPPPPIDAFGYESPPDAAPPYIPYDDTSSEVAPVKKPKKIDYDAELAKYEEMKKKGTLSDEEYEFAKKNLLKQKFEDSKKRLEQKKMEEGSAE